MRESAVARAVVAIALLLLGGVSLQRIPVVYTPSTALPLISISLSLPVAGEIEEVTQRWVLPLETEVRALGQVRGMRGEVDAEGAWLQVLFDVGVDPERKAARLNAAVERLRRALPERALLSVWPSRGSGNDLVDIVWAAEASEGQGAALAQRFRSLPGVRDAVVWGESIETTTFRIDSAYRQESLTLAAEIERAVRGAGRSPRLGGLSRAGESLPLLVAPTAWSEIGSLPVRVDDRVVPLDSIVEVQRGLAEAPMLSHVRGRRGVAIAVHRDHDASLLAVDARAEGLIRELQQEEVYAGRIWRVYRHAEPLRALLTQLLQALAALALVLAACGLYVAGWRGALALVAVVPLLSAAIVNVYALVGIGFDLFSLIASILAVATVAPFATLRLLAPMSGTPRAIPVVLFASLLPIAVLVAGGGRDSTLAGPANAFLLAVAAGCAAALLLPRALPRRPRSRRVGGLERRVLRDPLSAVLVAFTMAFVLLSLFGGGLEVASTPLQPDPGSLALQIALPQGTDLLETELRVSSIEQQLNRRPEIETHWSMLRPASATINVELMPEHRREDRQRELITRLRQTLPAEVVAIQPAYRIAAGGSFAGFGRAEEIEERAETDESARIYRVVLRSAELDLLRTAYDRIRDRAIRSRFGHSSIAAGWGAVDTEIELRPRPGTSPEQSRRIAADLLRQSSPPQRYAIPGVAEREFRVLPAAVEGGFAEAPALELLERPLAGSSPPIVPAKLLARHSRSVYPAVMRQSGRYVLPITFSPPHMLEAKRKQQREKFDRHLSRLALPAGVELERPYLGQAHFTQEKLRLVGTAAVLPLLLWIAAIFVTNSWRSALLSVTPASVAVLAVLPMIRAAGSRVDELGLFSMAAMLCAAVPVALDFVCSVARRSTLVGPAIVVYRSVRAWFAPAVTALLAAAVPTATFAVLAQRNGDVWAPQLGLAATIALAVPLAGLTLLPPLLLAARNWSRRDAVAECERRLPSVWREPGEPTLKARSLTKRYSNGFRALGDVSFEVGAGIVGLLGPNGAGKTTLIRLITGLLTPSRGQIRYRNVILEPDNIMAFRKQLGFLPQDFNTYASVTARQLLDHWARERGFRDRPARAAEVDRVLRIVGLVQDAGRRVSDYSGGMRRRVGIAIALIGDPDVLVVDEPTTGLDMASRIRFRETLLQAAERKIVLFSTHIPSDIEAVAGRVLLLHAGRLRFDGTPGELVARASGRVFEDLLEDDELRQFAARYRISSRVRTLRGVEVRAIAPPGEKPRGVRVEATLEEAYLAEIDQADRQAGATVRTGLFSFLDADDRAV